MTAETSNARGETYTFDMIEDAWGDAVPLTKPYFNRFRARLEDLLQSAAPPPAAAQQQGQPVACVACEGKPAPENNPCGWCGRTAPPSAPVGVEGWHVDPVEGDPDMLAIETPDGRTWFAKRGDRVFEMAEALALAQQPAAVDGAYPTPRNRAEAVALARLALAYLGVIDAHIDTAIARCETDLAAQHQETPK